MPKFAVALSRPSREYRIIEDIEAPDAASARRIALRASREIDAHPDATIADELTISEWENHRPLKARLRVESVTQE